MKEKIRLFNPYIYSLVSSIVIVVLALIYSSISKYEIMILLIITAFFFFINTILNGIAGKIITFIISMLIICYVIIQNIYYRGFFDYFKISYALNMLSTVIKFTDSTIDLIGKRDFVFPIIEICLFVSSFFFRTNNKISLKVRIIIMVICTVTIIGLVIAYNLNLKSDDKKSDYYAIGLSDYYIYDTIPSNELFVKKFGLLTFAYRDISSYLEKSSINEEAIPFIKSVLDKNKSKQNNLMSGVFKGKNILIIQAESFVYGAVNEVLTPNLYKLMNEGITIENFSTPMLPGSTSDTEFMMLTSLYANSDELLIYNSYPYNVYPTTIPLLFNDEGYTTTVYHNCPKSNYNRETIMSTFGFQSMYDNGTVEDSVEALDIVDRIKVAKNKQCLFWITYNGHNPYSSEDSTGVKKENLDKIHNIFPQLDDEVAIYLAKNMDLDYGIGLIINEIKNKGEEDEWVIVVYGDHKPKGLDLSPYKEILELKDDFEDTGLIIFNSNVSFGKQNKIATAIDILPTIGNMFSLDYEERNVMGRDIFDDNYHGFYFSNYENWKTQDYYYDIYEDKVHLYNNSEMSVEEARNEINSYKDKQQASYYILQTNYFLDN